MLTETNCQNTAMANHWKRKTRPILCMPVGMSRTASLISLKNPAAPPCLLRISCSSSSVGGTSLVESTDTRTEAVEQTAPIQKHT